MSLERSRWFGMENMPPVQPEPPTGLVGLSPGGALVFDSESKAAQARKKLRQRGKKGSVHKTRAGWILTRIS